jgi:hypothetical protein
VPETRSRLVSAQIWALAGTLLPAILVAVIAYAAAHSVDDTDCEGFGCASFGYGLISVLATFAAPVIAVLGQLVTAGLGAIWPALRVHPARLGLLGALVSWIVLGLVARALRLLG